MILFPCLVKKGVVTVMVCAFLGTQCLFAYQPENGFWAERRRATKRGASPLFASLPLGGQPVGINELSAQVAVDHLLGGGLSECEAGSVPKGFLKGHSALFAALSPAHGTVRKVSLPKHLVPGSPVVIHIQDVHMNPEAQWNIRETARSLMQSGQVDLVALEGATQEIHLQPFVDFPHRRAVEVTANYLLKQNKITGPIHAAFTATGTLPKILGIDDPVHYAAHVQAYRDSSVRLEKTRQDVQALLKEIEGRKKGVFSKNLFAFDQQVQSYQKGELSLGNHVLNLTERLGGNAVPSVRSFKEALALERTLDFKQVEVERAALITALTQRLNESETKDLVAQSFAYRSGQWRYGEFYSHLKELCRSKGLSLAHSPALEAYVRYVLTADGIDGERLLEDIADMEKHAYDRLAKSESEKALVAESRRAWFTEKLVNFAMTPADWKEYQATGIAGTKEELASFESFYREAQARDGAMAENLLRAIGTNGKAPTRTAVLVTGGYHAEGMTQRLVQQGVVVVSYVPKIEKIDTSQGSAYLSVFTQEKTPLEKLFAGQKLFLGMNPVAGLQAGAVLVPSVAWVENSSSRVISDGDMARIKEFINKIYPDAELTIGDPEQKQDGGWVVKVKVQVGEDIRNFSLVTNGKFDIEFFGIVGHEEQPPSAWFFEAVIWIHQKLGSYVNYMPFKRWKPIMQVNVSFPKALAMGVLYGTLIAFTPLSLAAFYQNLSFLMLGPVLGFLFFWPIAGRLHTWFDREVNTPIMFPFSPVSSISLVSIVVIVGFSVLVGDVFSLGQHVYEGNPFALAEFFPMLMVGATKGPGLPSNDKDAKPVGSLAGFHAELIDAYLFWVSETFHNSENYLRMILGLAPMESEEIPQNLGEGNSNGSGDEDTIGDSKLSEHKSGSLQTELLESLPQGVQSLRSVRISIQLEVDGEAMYLTLKNKKFKDECPGGGVNEGETLLQAVLRELKEELGDDWEKIDVNLIRISEKPILFHSITRPNGTVEYRTVHDVEITLNGEQLPPIDNARVIHESETSNWVSYGTVKERYAGFTLASRKVILARIIEKVYGLKAVFFRPAGANSNGNEFPLLITMDDGASYVMRELGKGEAVPTDKDGVRANVLILGGRDLILLPQPESEASSPSTLSWLWLKMPFRKSILDDVLRRAPLESPFFAVLLGVAVWAQLGMGVSVFYVVVVPLLAFGAGVSHYFGTYGMERGGLIHVIGTPSLKKGLIWLIWTSVFAGGLMLVGQWAPSEYVNVVLAFVTATGARVSFLVHRRSNREWLVNNLPDLTAGQRAVAREVLVALEGRPILLGVEDLRVSVLRVAEAYSRREGGRVVDPTSPAMWLGEGNKLFLVDPVSLADSTYVKKLFKLLKNDRSVFLVVRENVSGLPEDRVAVVPKAFGDMDKKGDSLFEVALEKVESHLPESVKNAPLQILQTPFLKLNYDHLSSESRILKVKKEAVVFILETMRIFSSETFRWGNVLSVMRAMSESA